MTILEYKVLKIYQERWSKFDQVTKIVPTPGTRLAIYAKIKKKIKSGFFIEN